MFGGGGRETLIINDEQVAAVNRGSETKAVGQFGAGMEVRFTPTIGWMSDFSWNLVGGPNNNFGMVRTGVTFAF